MDRPPGATHLVDTPPQRLILRDAIASRFETRSKEEAGRARRGLVSGCLYDAAGNRVELSQRRPDLPGRIPLCLDPPTLDLAEPSIAGAQRLPGRTLYLGNFMNHYGHFITETLSRLWSAERMADFDHIVAYAANADRGRFLPRRFHRDLLALFGLDLARIEILRAPARFDEIVVPEQLWSINHRVNLHLRPLYAGLRARHTRPESSGRIFLSRKESADARLANIAQIEAVFASFGFAVLYPEKLAIGRQLQLYAGCDILAAPSGSGLHNCLFTRPGTLTIDVGDLRSRKAPTRMQRMADELAAVKASFLPYRGGEDGRTDAGALAAALQDILGERPSLGRRVLFALTRAAGLRTQFRKLRRRIYPR